MKTKPEQYARALFETLKDKSKPEAKEAIRNFVSVLASQNQLSRTEKIIEEYIKIYNREEGIVEVELSCASGLDKAEEKPIADRVKELTQADKINITQVVDKELLGGIIIRFEDQIIDGCLRSRLDDLKNTLSK